MLKSRTKKWRNALTESWIAEQATTPIRAKVQRHEELGEVWAVADEVCLAA